MNMPDKKEYDVIIVGMGAAGLAAAYRLVESNSGIHILILEKGKVPGRKLSAAGNGKCNLTNKVYASNCYDSDNMEIAEKFFASHGTTDMISLLHDMGILLYEKNGYYYPLSNQGKQVTDHLFKRICTMYPDVMHIGLQQEVTEIQIHQHNAYTVTVKDHTSGNQITYTSNSLILATGGKAAPKLGGSEAGYLLAQQLHIKQIPTYSVLCPIYVKEDLTLAKGVRLDAVISLKTENGHTLKESGQMQWNKDCLSGIAMMNLSGFVNRNEAKQLSIDVLPEMQWEDLKTYILKQQKEFGCDTLLDLFNTFFPEAFSNYMMERLGLNDHLKLEKLTEKQINRITSYIKKLTFTPYPKEDYEKAQATGGGIALTEINMDTFEHITCKGLYMVGELLDIYGKCGGYNLTFAFLSGAIAADTIIQSMRMD